MTAPPGPLAAQRARTARLLAQAEGIAAERAGGSPAAPAAALPVALVPANVRSLVPLPDDARARFRAHLDTVIAEAFALPLRDNTAAMTAQAASERADAGEVPGRDGGLPAHLVQGSCATCRGECCTAGGTRAFLKADSLQRVRAQRATLGDADATPATIAALYLDALPPVHYDGSCVFHARAGCTLRRELRANLCNRYHCGELTQLARTLQATGAAAAYVGAATGERLARMALIGRDRLDVIAVDGGGDAAP